jgi:phage shock protein C
MKTQLYRSRTDSMLGGVCGGLGAYLGIDPVLVRLFFVLLTITGGAGVLIYLICWIIIPLEGAGALASAATMRAGADELATRAQGLGAEIGAAARTPHPQAALLIGAALLFVGVIALLRNLGLPWVGWIDGDTLWPLLLIGGGVALMLRRRQGEPS